MKLLFVLLLLVTSAFAADPPAPAFPAHSVNGDVTVDVADIAIPIPYATTEARAVVSVCTGQPYTTIQILVTNADGTAESKILNLSKLPTGKWCGAFVAMAAQANIRDISMDLINSIKFSPPPPATPTK